LRLLRDWSGIVSVVLLITGLLQDIADISPVTILILGTSALAYVAFWYNFARVAQDFKGLPLRQGLTISVIGVIATFSAIANFGISGMFSWVFLGLAMLGVAWGVLKAPLLPNGFAWLSGIAGITTITVGVTGDTSDIGTGAMFILMGWVFSTSILYIVWGHFNEENELPESRPRG
jgi:hypothetical protein